MELLQLERSGIRVAEYVTELPPREVLEKKLQTAIAVARKRMEARSPSPESAVEMAIAEEAGGGAA